MKKIIVFSILALSVAAVSGSRLAHANHESVFVENADVASVLNHLIERAVDGQKGFKEAAEHAKSSDLKNRFNARAEERGKFVNELQAKVIDFNKKAQEKGSAVAAVHRAWIDLKSAVRTDDDKAVLTAVKTGEGKALDDYRDALNQNLPSEVRGLIEKQTKEIESSYEWTLKQIKDIEDKEAKN